MGDSHVREKLRLDELVSLRKCHKSFKFNELSLNYKGFETDLVVRKALDAIKKLKVLDEETAYKVVDEIFDNEYLPEWFDFQYQYEQALEKDKFRVKRIIKYICDKGFKIIETDVPFIYSIQSMYRGYQINYIADKIDFVFGIDDDVYLVNIRSGENPYSHRARKKENYVDNSMELLGTAIGMIKRYPGKKVHVESWYIKNKDDKSHALVPEYEHRKGKNIAGILASNLEDLKKRFYEVATFPEDGPEKCDTCIHKRICRVAYDVKLDTSVVMPAEKKSDGVKVYTENQKAVIDHMEGPMCVIAGPGSGKTFALVERLANMLKKGIRPENILLVTFTNKAVEEIRTRVKAILNTSDDKAVPNIYTYNALGYTILKENPILIGKRVKLADKVDRYNIIAEVLKKAPRIHNVSYDVYGDYGLIKRLDEWFLQIELQGKEVFIQKNTDKDCDGVLTAYEIYKQLFNERGYIDFDMQISLVNHLFQKYPQLAEAYAKKFKYIMVDEFQDSSEDQATMIYAIAKKHNNIVVVGDDDQSIYGWRGGSNKFILGFGHDFPAAKVVIMSDNFRSTDTILQSANNVIADNGERYEKKIIGHKTGTFQPIYFQNSTAERVPYLIGEIIKKGYQLSDIAVLGRNHTRLKEVMDALDGKYKVFAPNQFLYEDPIFSTIFDVLTLYYEGMDNDEALYRYLRRMGANGIHKRNKKESLYRNLIEAKQIIPIDKMDVNCLASYERYKNVSAMMAAGYKLIKCFKTIQYKGMALKELLDVLYGVKEHIVIDQLLEIAEQRAIVSMTELYKYMGNMVLYQDERVVEYEPQKDAVQLLTCHSAKGKEFPVVIVYGTEDFNSSSEEEVRLFYVSITRAQKVLFFLETVCNKCELLPKLKGSVILR